MMKAGPAERFALTARAYGFKPSKVPGQFKHPRGHALTHDPQSGRIDFQKSESTEKPRIFSNTHELGMHIQHLKNVGVF
jgi:hypothetical protein